MAVWFRLPLGARVGIALALVGASATAPALAPGEEVTILAATAGVTVLLLAMGVPRPPARLGLVLVSMGCCALSVEVLRRVQGGAPAGPWGEALGILAFGLPLISAVWVLLLGTRLREFVYLFRREGPVARVPVLGRAAPWLLQVVFAAAVLPTFAKTYDRTRAAVALADPIGWAGAAGTWGPGRGPVDRVMDWVALAVAVCLVSVVAAHVYIRNQD